MQTLFGLDKFYMAMGPATDDGYYFDFEPLDGFKISEEDIIKNKEVNAYGAVSVAIVGSILIIAGLIISVILKLT